MPTTQPNSFDHMSKLSQAEKQARVVPPTVPRSQRKETLRRATSMVRAEAQIDFCRDDSERRSS